MAVCRGRELKFPFSRNVATNLGPYYGFFGVVAHPHLLCGLYYLFDRLFVCFVQFLCPDYLGPGDFFFTGGGDGFPCFEDSG